MAPVECLNGNVPASPRSVLDMQQQDQQQEEIKTRTQNTVAFRLEESSALDEEDGEFRRVKCCYGPIRPELTPEEYDLLYWKKKDFKKFKRESKNLALTTDEEKHKVYLKTFLDVYSNPPDEKKVGIVPSRDVSCLPLATASVRGLERYIFPGLLLDQSRTKQAVVKAQAHLPAEMTTKQRAFVLASTSTLLSLQSRRVARVIGHADSIVALGIYKATFLPKGGKNNKKSSSSSTSSSKS